MNVKSIIYLILLLQTGCHFFLVEDSWFELSFPSPKLVTLPKLENSVCSKI